MNTVFVLTSLMPNEHPDNDLDLDSIGKYDVADDGSISAHEYVVGMYSSVVEAEKAINALIASNAKTNNSEYYKGWLEYFGFMVEEKQLNPEMDEYGNIPEFESIRTYLADGTLNCVCEHDSSCKKKFVGRKDPIKVQSDEFAFLWSNSRIVPIYLKIAPYTEEEWKENFSEGVEGDFIDDSGLAYAFKPGHIHPIAPFIFPLYNLKHYARIPNHIAQQIIENSKREF